MTREQLPERLETGVPGFDTVLQGGLLSGAVYILQGPPGSGKTILANQVCFNHAAAGGRCVYFTLLSESHDRLLRQLLPMDFYAASRIPDSIYYESAFGVLESEGLPGVLRLLTSERRARHASLLILDGLFVLEEMTHSEADFRRFVNELGSFAHLTDTTVLLLTNSSRSPASPEYTMVDGWVELGTMEVSQRVLRFMQVHKFRGSGFALGKHITTISNRGVRVLPRLESALAVPAPPRWPPGRISTGVAELDTMLHGGVDWRDTTLVVGPTGVGKTSLGLHFIGACTEEQPGLVFGFYEDRDGLLEKAASMNIDLQAKIEAGSVQAVCYPAGELLLDEVGYALLDSVRARGVRRVFVDGLDAFRQAAAYPERLTRFLSMLAAHLQAAGATALFTMEVPELIGGEFKLQFGSMSAVADNIIILRYVETAAEVRRTLTIMKARRTGFDPRIRGFRITGDGVHLDAGGHADRRE